MLCPLWALNNNFLFSPFASAIQMQAGWFDDSPFCTRRIEFPSCKIPGRKPLSSICSQAVQLSLSVYNLVYRIKVSAALSQNQYKKMLPYPLAIESTVYIPCSELGTQSDNLCSAVEGVTISSDAICDDTADVASLAL